MKKLIIRFLAISALLILPIHAQAPVAANEKATLAQLKVIQLANQALIERQQKTLQALDEMKITSEQIKAFGRR